MVGTKIVSENYSEYDVTADAARQKSRGITNSLLEEMEDSARYSRRQDELTLGKIDSILNINDDTTPSQHGQDFHHQQASFEEIDEKRAINRARRRRAENKYIVKAVEFEADGPVLPSEILAASKMDHKESPLVVVIEHYKSTPRTRQVAEAEPPPARIARAVNTAKRAAQKYDDNCFAGGHEGHGPRAHSHPPGHAGNESHGNEQQSIVHTYRKNHKNPYQVAVPRVPVSEKRKQVERRLDSLLDYEMPTAEHFYDMRAKLRGVNEKMLGHRLLLDRYTGVELTPGGSVQDSIESKYHQLAQRMPELENYRQVRPRKTAEEKLYYDSPRTTVGYTGSLMPKGQEVSELRGRMRRLLCRSKDNPHYYRM